MSQNQNGGDDCPPGETFCVVCGECHPAAKTRSHENAAAEYEEKYGVSI